MCKQPFQNKIPSRPCFNPSIKKNQNGIVRFIGYRVFGDGPAAVHNLNSNRKPGFVIHITGLSSSAFHHNLSTCSWEVIYPMIWWADWPPSTRKGREAALHDPSQCKKSSEWTGSRCSSTTTRYGSFPPLPEHRRHQLWRAEYVCHNSITTMADSERERTSLRVLIPIQTAIVCLSLLSNQHHFYSGGVGCVQQ